MPGLRANRVPHAAATEQLERSAQTGHTTGSDERAADRGVHRRSLERQSGAGWMGSGDRYAGRACHRTGRWRGADCVDYQAVAFGDVDPHIEIDLVRYPQLKVAD